MHKAANAVIDEIGSGPTGGRRCGCGCHISANNDAAIGKIMADALAKVGKDGVVTVEEGKSLETWVDVVEGMQFDRGFLSPNFVTDTEKMEVVLDKPLVWFTKTKSIRSKPWCHCLKKP